MQPSVIKINDSAATSLACYGLSVGTEYKTRIQFREPGDKSKIVYVTNYKHDPTDRFSPQHVALTDLEYSTVESA